jgi:16S rRNA (guanine(966)-N(2))-methyltransferase RsmD
VRLAVINLLAAEIPGCRWLDLCCGSGAMACEALQRGAAEVVAVEKDRRIATVARANLEAVTGGLSAPARARVVSAEVLHWLGRGAGGCGLPRFDLIYADPPYAAGLHGPIAAAVKAGGWLGPGGLLVWECASAAVPLPPQGWTVRDSRRYGGSTVVLLEEAKA